MYILHYVLCFSTAGLDHMMLYQANSSPPHRHHSLLHPAGNETCTHVHTPSN